MSPAPALHRLDPVMTTYYATPRHGLSALVCLWWTIQFTKLAGKIFIGAYEDGPDRYAVVVEG